MLHVSPSSNVHAMSCSVSAVYAPTTMDIARLDPRKRTSDRSPDDRHIIVPSPPAPPWVQPVAQSLLGCQTTVVEPPTKAKWESFRPMITELYKHKQFTARQIIEELRKQGLNASEKMLRDRFRAWEINTKNRTSKRPGPDNAANEDATVRPPVVDVVRLGGLTYPVNAAPADAMARRSMLAVSDWYDHILDNHDTAFSSWEQPCSMFDVTYKFSVTLYGLRESNYKFGWKKLREIGSQIDNALLSSHSLSLIWLIINMITWKCGHPQHPEIIDAVRRFWAIRSREVLGARHPITIIVAALCHRSIPEELIDQFFVTINSKLSDATTVISEQQQQVASQGQIVYAQLLLTLQRYEKADGILATLATNRASSQADVYIHAQVLRVQAVSQKEQGNFARADDLFRDTHAKLKECGKEMSAVTSITLIHHAKVKDALCQLMQCEQLLYEALRIQKLCTGITMLQQPIALYYLQDVLRRRGKVEAVELLEQTYPEAFESLGAPAAEAG